MRVSSYVIGLLGAMIAGAASAQTVPRSTPISITRGEFSVSPYGGYLVSQRFIHGPLDTSLGVVGSALYGVQASFPLAPGSSLVGALGYSSGDLEVGVPLLGGVSIGNSVSWMFDANVELRADSWESSGKRFVPVVQLGGGAMHRELSVMGITAKTTDFMVTGAVGADLPLMPNLSIRLMAKDYWGKADFGSIGPLNATTKDLHTIALSSGLRLSF